MNLTIILDDIGRARERWGTELEDQNTLNDWITHVNFFIAQAGSMSCRPEDQRPNLVWAAGILAAAIETFDRNGQFAPRHYENRVAVDLCAALKEPASEEPASEETASEEPTSEKPASAPRIPEFMSHEWLEWAFETFQCAGEGLAEGMAEGAAKAAAEVAKEIAKDEAKDKAAKGILSVKDEIAILRVAVETLMNDTKSVESLSRRTDSLCTLIKLIESLVQTAHKMERVGHLQ